MANARKLYAIDVKNEVESIKKLPWYERKGGMVALQERIKADIENYYKEIEALSESEQSSEYARITGCYNVLRWKWKKKLWYYNYDLNKERNDRLARENGMSVNTSQYVVKAAATHESGLPVPQRAQVYIWWQNDELIFVSAATMFSLSVTRVIDMGLTTDSTSYWSSGYKAYLTITYDKEGEKKFIVVWLKSVLDVTRLIKYFHKIKGTREMNKQEL